MRKAARKAPGANRNSVVMLRNQDPIVGRVVGFEDGQWLVECFTGNRPTRARTTLSMSAAQMQAAADAGREALMVFENRAADRPIVVGLLATPVAEPIDVAVDGRRITLEARDEIVLRCGSASITLRRNGRLVIRGSYVETRAAGVNRIKGGSVSIN